ncbi:GNAT family N-acetyltransferase [Namhaeicola litoreus]|uniref:GNAT family N-acetyltransferase n=1 Tax=Namhaeicola litoreus TaxID=1052145 RepID=A0ABW3Y0S4_9FLAO
MNRIVRATVNDCEPLNEIAKISFLEAHGKSAPTKDINSYVSKNFGLNTFIKELKNPENLYYLIYHDQKLAGYSKTIFNRPNENIRDENIAKLERFYLLSEFYGKGIAGELFNFNKSISYQKSQKGIWLAVWIENHRAIQFYTKNGFKRVGSYDFQISETHVNPNHIMYLAL